MRRNVTVGRAITPVAVNASAALVGVSATGLQGNVTSGITEPASVLALTSTAVTVTEGQSFNVAASRTGSFTHAVEVDYAIGVVTTTPQSGTLAWAALENGPKSASVLAGLVDGTENGTITLSNPRRTDAGTPAPSLGTSSGSITVNDVAAPVAGSNAARLDAILDNYTLPSIMTGLTYPADPVTTTTHEVRTNAELTTAVGGDGRLIRIFGPSNGGLANYAQFNLGGRSDIDIVMDNDATITGSSGWAWWSAVRRIRWTGGNINISSGNADGFQIADSEDVIFDDVRMTRGGTEGHIFYPGTTRNRRFAMINSAVEFTAIGPGIYYAVFSAGTASNRGDWIFLNNRFIGQGPPVRLMDLGLRTAIVGNYFSEFPAPASIRIHEENDKLWFAHNVSVHGGGNQYNFSFVVSGNSVNVSSVMNDFLIEDNLIFATRSNIGAAQTMRLGDITAENRSQATNWVIRGNKWSDPTAPSVGAEHGWFLIDVPYTAENNLRVGPGHADYETAPAASTFGAIR